MIKIIDLKLNKTGLKQLQQEIDSFKAKADIAAKNIVLELSEYGLKEMQNIYNNFDLHSNKPNIFYITGTDNEKKIVMEGEQAIYDEFGTGTEGEKRPHPIKGEFELNDYNSGKTIRLASDRISKMTTIPINGLYWTYKGINGEIIYTQGTPAQKEGYDSCIATAKKAPETIKKVMKEVMFSD